MQDTSRNGQRLLATALVFGLLCALALMVAAAARPQSAQAAKVTRGVATGTIYFNKRETRTIAEVGAPGAGAACGALLPWPANLVCVAAAAWGIQANRAQSRDMCLKVKYLLTRPEVSWPDIYRGGYCR